MRKCYYIASLILANVATVLTASLALAYNFDFKVVTPSTYGASLALNSAGHVLYGELLTYPQRQLRLYRGPGDSIPLATGNTTFEGTRLNRSDQAVWYSLTVGSKTDVYLYNGSETRLTDSSTDNLDHYWPQINDAAQITWLEQANNGTYRVVLYQGGTTTYLGNGRRIETAPQINNLGQVAWSQDDGSNPDAELYQIYLFDGSTTRQITFDNRNKHGVGINDRGDLLWAQDTDVANLWELILCRNETKTTITTELGVNQSYGLNAKGQAYWTSSGWGLYFYDGSTNHFVDWTDKTAGYGFNDWGQLAYNSTGIYTYNEFWFYDGPTGAKFPIDQLHRSRYSIALNNRGQILVSYPDGTVYLINSQNYVPAINLLLLE